MMVRTISWAVVICAVQAVAVTADASLRDTPHNFTVTGTGTVVDSTVTELCVFCHTPHNSSPQHALWNRQLPGSVYTLYDSSSLSASGTLNQPSGASRLCLSCHDGTLALGALLQVPQTGPTMLGQLTGQTVLGTDLSDDHPVSFEYNSNLVALEQGELADPMLLPSHIRLDGAGQLQCTACHDPHDDPYRKFLVADDRAGALCTTCHTLRDWPLSSHATSPKTWSGLGPDPWPHTPYETVADNACESCHRPHAAPRPQRLLSTDAIEPMVCLFCHNDGNVATKDLGTSIGKGSGHRVFFDNWTHEPGEDPNTMSRHVACADCHNPHKVNDTPASAPAISGRQLGVPGVNTSGGTVPESVYQYEVCYKCHGVRDQATPMAIVRVDNTRNVRLETDQSNLSYHPVTAIGRNQTMGGFEPGYSTASIIYCVDCHNDNDWTGTGTVPRGPHGSLYSPILEREYRTDDPTPESFQNYELCYKCHNRNYLITDQAGTFPHNRHVVNSQSSCAVCHDAHGSRQDEHLINFMEVDQNGQTVVTQSSSQRLEYNSFGPGSGECYLSCHSVDHNPRTYP